MPYLFTSESVSEGHPDKIADQISDAILDSFLKNDPHARVACETLVTTGLTVISGEVRSTTYVDVQKIAREVIKGIGYDKAEYQFSADSCGVITSIHEQSPDIAQGVDAVDEHNIGAGDQGMMFGYACDETRNFMPLPIELSHRLLRELAHIRKHESVMTYLRPDSKAQVTMVYDDQHKPLKVNTIVLSTQHDDFAEESVMLQQIKEDVKTHLLPRVIESCEESIRHIFHDDIILHVNPTGKFVIGGPHGDTGLTGRKIIVDTYGGRGAHGGGAFSGKDATKVDRSAAYATRHIAKNIIASGLAKQCLVQVAYAIGISDPVGLFIDTFGTCIHSSISDDAIAKQMMSLFDLRPGAIINSYGLKNPIFLETAAYGHMGRISGSKTIDNHLNSGQSKQVETFTWEKLNRVDDIREAFNL